MLIQSNSFEAKKWPETSQNAVENLTAFPKRSSKCLERLRENVVSKPYLLWMEEILHQLIDGLSHYL